MQDISSVTGAFVGKVLDVRAVQYYRESVTHCNQVDCERDLDDIYEELKGQVEVGCSQIPSHSTNKISRGSLESSSRDLSINTGRNPNVTLGQMALYSFAQRRSQNVCSLGVPHS